jgi:hypothetical protein
LRATYTLGLDPMCVALLSSLFLLVVVVLSTTRKGHERSPARKVLPRTGSLPRAYKRWSYEELKIWMGRYVKWWGDML